MRRRLILDDPLLQTPRQIDRHTHFDAHGHDLLDHVRSTLLNQLRQKRVVFTGHGSGAAVVSWVYMQLLRETKESDKGRF